MGRFKERVAEAVARRARRNKARAKPDERREAA